jgi:hypothetical protein
MTEETDADRISRETAEIYDRDCGRLISEIIRPTAKVGGSMSEVLVLLEGIVTGVLTVGIKLGGDEAVLDVFIDGVRKRMAEIRLEMAQVAGSA